MELATQSSGIWIPKANTHLSSSKQVNTRLLRITKQRGKDHDVSVRPEDSSPVCPASQFRQVVRFVPHSS